MNNKKTKSEEGISTVIKSEILMVADMVAKEKGVDREEILLAMEEAILKIAQLKYGTEKELVAIINRKTSEIEIYVSMLVVENVENSLKEISLNDASKKDSDCQIGDTLKERLPAIEFCRVAAQSARQIITQKVKLVERKKQQEEFAGRVGEIITGVIKRLDFSDVILEVGRTEGLLKKTEIIPNETFRIGDRIKVFLAGVNKSPDAPLLHLSRTHPDFLKKLFEQEVPEIYDGIVKIVGVARDPGSKAKISVSTSDSNIDPIGACVGIRGSRVQSVVDELKGEKIDIILWHENPATFIVNSLSPASAVRVIMDETDGVVDVVVPNEQFSIAIGRRGQNVRLASKLSGWNISVVTEEEDTKNRAKESARLLKLFTEGLDVDDMIAHLLIGEGYSSIEDLNTSSLSDIAALQGFDEGIATEIKNRAESYVLKKKESVLELCNQKGVNKDLIEYNMIKLELLEVLVKSDIKSLDDLGALATDELLEISEDLLTKREAETLIMVIREKWFSNV